MPQFKAIIKQAVSDWNKKNPDKRELTLTSLAEKIGTSKQFISQINTVYLEQLESHCQVIFMNKDEDEIRKMWEHYITIKSDKLIQRLELIRVELGVEIWDLIQKVEKDEKQ